MQLRCKRKIYKEIYRMFAGDFLMLRNKRHFVISVIAINVFYCISKYIHLLKQFYNATIKWLIHFFFNEIVFYRKQIGIDLEIKKCPGHRIICSSNFKALKQQREGGNYNL